MENRELTLLIVCGFLLFLDLYISRVLLHFFDKTATKKRKLFLSIFWVITIITMAGMLIGIFFSIGRNLRTVVMVWFFLVYFSKLFALPIYLSDDIRRLIKWLINKISRSKKTEKTPLSTSDSIPRSEFLIKAGIAMAAIPFASLSFGILSGVHDYKIKRVILRLPNLPKAFHGLRIAQISDIHAGSFYNKKAVTGGVDLLMAEKPDLVFFTGDIVNDSTDELRNYTDVFDKIKAPLGVYSVLGNHDYGDYRSWQNARAKAKNFQDLVTVQKNMGWDLLINENRILEQSGDKLAIVGIENWGTGRFPKKGRMDLAMPGTEEAAVKLLLSHDPSHWRAEVLEKYSDVDAMFSGHTHGMQFGVQVGDLQWSPVQYIYPEWAGLYQHQAQQLYVNVGYGFIGYPGRVGIYPEITIFELNSSANY